MSEVVQQMAVIRELEDRLKVAKQSLRERLFEQMEMGDAKAAWLDNVRLGRAFKVAGNKMPVVYDERAVVEWVKKNRPEHVVERVIDSYLQVLKDSCKRHGEAVDESTGEIVPGIELSQGAPYIKYVPDEGCTPVIELNWRELVGPVLTQIERGAA